MDTFRTRRMRAPLALADEWAEDVASVSQRVARDGFLAMDMYETDGSYVIKVALPGVAADDLTITREGDAVTLEGDLNVAEADGATYLFRERSGGHFTRVVPIPRGAASDVSATLEAGVLSLEFAKPEQRIPRTIMVTAQE